MGVDIVVYLVKVVLINGFKIYKDFVYIMFFLF